MLIGLHHSAVVYATYPERGYSFARTDKGEVVLIHVNARRKPQLDIKSNPKYRMEVSFAHCHVKDSAELPPPVGTEVRFLPRVTTKGYATEYWIEKEAWDTSEIGALSVQAYEIYYRNGIEAKVTLHFWGKLGEFVKQFPWEPYSHSDPFRPWERGYQSTRGEFFCLHSGQMLPCPDPRYMAA